MYGFGSYRSVAQRFKQQFNENSKSPAKWEYFPELNHNEIVGWEGKRRTGQMVLSYYSSATENEPVEIESRIDTTKAIMERAGLIMFDLYSAGQKHLGKDAFNGGHRRFH